MIAPSLATGFDEAAVLRALRQYLPAQAPLKDFAYHNPLHGFQDQVFFDGLRQAAGIFGYQTTLALREYRALYDAGRIRPALLDHIIAQRRGQSEVDTWRHRALHTTYPPAAAPRIGALRAAWKQHYQLDLDARTQPLLFRVLCAYFNQGTASWKFLVAGIGFLESLRELEKQAHSASLFRGARARRLLLETDCTLPDLLALVVGPTAADAARYDHYLFDQQFAHPGWSGMVAAVEAAPQTLPDQRPITLRELIAFELVLEIDALDAQLGVGWAPLSTRLHGASPVDLFAPVPAIERDEVIAIWQAAFEWTYYDEVLAGVTEQQNNLLAGRAEAELAHAAGRSFQALFCMDDREESLRRYLEQGDVRCETFGTPGHFGVQACYQAAGSRFMEQICPATTAPRHLIREEETNVMRGRSPHATSHMPAAYSGRLTTQALGFRASTKLFFSTFQLRTRTIAASSLRYVGASSQLLIENRDPTERVGGLQAGFTVPEMAATVHTLLLGIGMVQHFAPLVYVVGHGASSVNNPHYAAYDCDACSGRPGSVNARAIVQMANDLRVRELLRARGLDIPAESQFLGSLHDTTRDEIVFFGEDTLSAANHTAHQRHHATFVTALALNAKERSRRFASIDTKQSPARIHAKMRQRSEVPGEPRPELGHATNALCVVGRRALKRHLLLDRRAFLNSYDYATDTKGEILSSLLDVVVPLCGNINLAYYFSRVDNPKPGAGISLANTAMGLMGVPGGTHGDLLPGLPSRLVEVHDPVRLLFVIEQRPEVVLLAIRRSAATYEWFRNEWVQLVVADPDTRRLFRFTVGEFAPYKPLSQRPLVARNVTELIETHSENLPVYLI